MRNILQQFLAASLLVYLPAADRNGAAKDVFHTFVIGVFFFPLLGGWLADRFLGKYRTLLIFSLIYSLGQGLLVAFVDDRNGFFAGLFLIALGSGGIKPVVASFVGDQFDSRTKHLAKLVFDAFYWIINFGSFFATLLMPIFLSSYGPRVAFGVPGVLMLTSTVVLWSGRKLYVMVPVAPPDPDSFLRVARTALVAPGPHRRGLAVAVAGLVLALASFALLPWLDIVPVLCLTLVFVLTFGGAGVWMQLERARGHHADEAVDGVRAVLRVLVMFALVTPFWSLFDQKASTWVIQAGEMDKADWIQPSHMQVLNPLNVMILIPFNNLVLFPWLRRRGWEPTPLRRMTAGLVFTGAAWVVVAILQVVMDRGVFLPIGWQVVPFALLTMGEVLVSATGLEFAYSQAPPSMKAVIMSFWLLAVTIGNLWVLLADAAVKNHAVLARVSDTGLSVTAFLMFFFAAFAFAAALAFGAYARQYRMVDHYRR
jgi:POT family proton-dependent oligopeptide transporter